MFVKRQWLTLWLIIVRHRPVRIESDPYVSFLDGFVRLPVQFDSMSVSEDEMVTDAVSERLD